MAANAAERLLGLDDRDLEALVKDCILGQLRSVIADLEPEDFFGDPDRMANRMQDSLVPELEKIGLQVHGIYFRDVLDEAGVIQAKIQKAELTPLG